MSQPKQERDTPWKDILGLYFEEFVAYCWPNRYVLIDWSKGYKSLDKELSKIARNAPVGNRLVDKLIEVYLKDGEAAYVIVHLEVQGASDAHFEERMFTYFYRLRDLHHKPIASLAILIDRDEKWRPGVFRQEFWGAYVEMGFPIIKLIDYREKLAELEQSENPFAQVILAQLTALEKQLPEAKLMSKINLIKRLYRRAWKKEDIVNLFIFIDWVLALPAPLEQQCQAAIQTFEEELQVNYITSFERIGIQKGEGSLLICLLEDKFKTIPEQYRKQIEQANSDDLMKWGKRILHKEKLEEVFEA